MEDYSKATQKCLANKDNGVAFKCLKKVVAQSKNGDGCKPRLVLLVQGGCVPCKEEIALHTSDISKGIIEKIECDSPEGVTIMANNNINAAPSLILLDCHGKIIKPV